MLARDERDRGHTNGAARAAPQPAPRELAAERHLVEPFAPVIANAARQDVALPRDRGCFEPGELAEYFRDAARAFEHVTRIGVLPAGEELRELGGRDGLDLTAERVDRVAVDPRQQPALTPRFAA